jgi:hypothetical protein
MYQTLVVVFYFDVQNLPNDIKMASIRSGESRNLIGW